MKFNKELSIETKSEAWCAVAMSMLFILITVVFGYLYSLTYERSAMYLLGAFIFGSAGIAIIPSAIINLKDTYSTWEELEQYVEEYHNLKLAESDDFSIDTSSFD